MVRGFYTAASGMISQEKRLNAIANNIANTSTAGYKRDDLVLGTFGEHLAVRMNTYNQSPLIAQGDGVFMQTVDSKYTDYVQGGFDYTSRPLDLAIQGEGFFVIRDAAGELRFTRNGQFALDEEGYLILPGYGRVQGEGGDIEIGTSSFAVGADGTVYRMPTTGDAAADEPEEIDALMLAAVDDYAELEKLPSGLFAAENYSYLNIDASDTAVLQGTLEHSNVNITEEMTNMLASQRSLQAASQLVRMHDEMTEQANNQINRL